MLVFNALSLHNKRVEFTLEDCPVFLRNDQVVLARHEGSDILHAGTIVRKDKTTGVAEGDCLFQKGVYQGVVVYNQGFKVQNADGRICEFKPGKDIEVREGKKAEMCTATHSSSRQAIAFFYKGRAFSMKALLQYEEPFVVIHTQSDYFRKAVPADIKLMTGVGEYCYGDLTKEGGRVVLRDLLPCVIQGDKVTLLSDIGDIGGKIK